MTKSMNSYGEVSIFIILERNHVFELENYVLVSLLLGSNQIIKMLLVILQFI